MKCSGSIAISTHGARSELLTASATKKMKATSESSSKQVHSVRANRFDSGEDSLFVPLMENGDDYRAPVDSNDEVDPFEDNHG